MSSRKQSLYSWLQQQFPHFPITLQSLAGDAGFRRYYRFFIGSESYIAVDAPPEWSNNVAFVALSQGLSSNGINTPDIVNVDLELGFMCLSDLGDELLSHQLTTDNCYQYYSKVMSLLPAIAKVDSGSKWLLPLFDKTFIETELAIFPQWLLTTHLNIKLSLEDLSSLEACFAVLIDNALEQPAVTMHRDFHSRNLMLLPGGDIGVIDFQDAVKGPITYDIVSLLRDCYIQWPDTLVYRCLADFKQHMINANLLSEDVTDDTFIRWFDLMGIQRHCKAAGIFARLLHRDNKPGYINDVPRTLDYIVHVSEKYPELSYLTQLVKNEVIPAVLKDIS